MNAGTIELAKTLLAPMGLEPLQAGGGGGTDPNAPTRYVDGGAIGVELIRGDVSAMGLGTVTRVEGDKLVAFGHPMMQTGVTALPTAIGKVLWFLASDMRSFKIGMPVRDIGAMVQTTLSEKQDVTWTAKSKLKIKNHGEITIEDFGVSIGGTPEPNEFMRSNLVRAVGSLMNNPWEPIFIERADMEIELRFAREILQLRGAELLEPEVDAGEPARIRLTLVPYAGPEVHKVITVPLPAHLAGQTVTLEIAPGYTEQRDMADPENVSALVRNLQNPLFPIQSVVVSYSGGDGAVSYKGHVAKNLPPGALDAIRPTSASVAPDSFKSTSRHVIPLGEFMVGEDRVEVSVKPVLR
jgi:hypothetical protein